VTVGYEFPRAALAVDCTIFGLDDEGLKILLVQRGIEPYRGRWALPGGFVRVDETLAQAARRELAEETALERVALDELGAFDALDRDPRERVISFAFTGLVKLSDHRVHAATDAAHAAWFALDDLPRLAFDHDAIVAAARAQLRRRVRTRPIGFELLPARFTLSQLQRVYEIVLERPLDKRNFRKKVLALGLLEELDEVEEDVAHRAARLYRFDERRYRALTKRGFDFSL
jgi:8-oxo-dGTP diphosphatase